MKRACNQVVAPGRCPATPHKARYRKAVHAWRIGAKQVAKQGQALFVYRCQSCGWWHLTHRDLPGSTLIETKASPPREEAAPRKATG